MNDGVPQLDVEWALERWVEPAALTYAEWSGGVEPTGLDGWTVLIGRHARAALALATSVDAAWDRVRAPLASVVVICLTAESTLNPYEDVAAADQYKEAMATLRLGVAEDLDRPADADAATTQFVSALDDLEDLVLASDSPDGPQGQGGLGLERLRSAALYELALAALYMIAAPISDTAD